MSQTDRAATGKRLYERFLAPLVTGGDLTPGPAIGAEAALDLDGALAAVDPSVRTSVDVARVRVARRLVAIDTLEGPSADEWALAAALHDLVHSLHPGFTGLLQRRVPEKLLDFSEGVLRRVPGPASLASEVSRYSYFARVFELTRTDTALSWWTGSQTFLGTAPPPRLLAWPELRRVHEEKTTHALVELPALASGPRQHRFWDVLGLFLEKLPLLDLATAARAAPAFAWNGSNLGLFATPHGQRLAHRALALAPRLDVDAALGRATHAHVKAGAWGNVASMADVLAERALALAVAEPRASAIDGAAHPDAVYAAAFGALVALPRVTSLGLGEERTRAVTARLLPLTRSAPARALVALLEGAGHSGPDAPSANHFLAMALENAAGSVGGSSTSSDA